MGRQARGVRLIRLDVNQLLAAVVVCDEENSPSNIQEGTIEELSAEEQAVFDAAEQTEEAIEQEDQTDSEIETEEESEEQEQ